MSDFVVQLVPMMLIQVILLFGVVPLARRVSPNLAVVWIICSLIPVLGVFTFYFLVVRVLVAILDRLEKLRPVT
jgi:hypothetical protein